MLCLVVLSMSLYIEPSDNMNFPHKNKSSKDFAMMTFQGHVGARACGVAKPPRATNINLKESFS